MLKNFIICSCLTQILVNSYTKHILYALYMKNTKPIQGLLIFNQFF